MTTTLLTPPVVDDATRRGFLTGLAAAGLLAGCSTERTPGAGGTTVAGFPRTVDHSGGTVTLDGPPNRVFLGTTRGALDELLAIGVLPAAIALGPSETLPSWAVRRGAADLVRLDGTALDLEELATLGIDLNLLPAFLADGDEATRLAALAPNVRLADFSDSTTHLDLFGRLFGREEQAAAVDRERLDRIAAWEPPTRPAVLTVFFAVPAGGVFVYLPGSGSMYGLLDVAGLPLSDRGEPAGEFGFALSAENLGRLDADLVLSVAPYPGDAPALDAIEASPVFAAVPAVRDGRYRRLDTEESQALLTASSLSTPSALDALTRVLST